MTIRKLTEKEIEKRDDEDYAFAQWLEDTLIPDLEDSGLTSTADDFKRCARIIKRSYRRIQTLRDQHVDSQED